MVADTNPWATAKWEEGVSWDAFKKIPFEAFWLESIRILIVFF
jgi:hypothetical protein